MLRVRASLSCFALSFTPSPELIPTSFHLQTGPEASSPSIDTMSLSTRSPSRIAGTLVATLTGAGRWSIVFLRDLCLSLKLTPFLPPSGRRGRLSGAERDVLGRDRVRRQRRLRRARRSHHRAFSSILVPSASPLQHHHHPPDRERRRLRSWWSLQRVPRMDGERRTECVLPTSFCTSFD